MKIKLACNILRKFRKRYKDDDDRFDRTFLGFKHGDHVKITGVKGEVSPTKLNQALTNATTGTINVLDSSNFPNPAGYIKIDNEILYYDNVPNATSLRIKATGGRAQGGTTAASHENASIIELYISIRVIGAAVRATTSS